MARGYTLTQTGSEVQEILNDEPTKQDRLVSGENIKTINNQSILGPGNISVVPTTRTVNGKALSSNISLTASDVGAYVKPDDGIPGSDLASGVIPDVSQFITKSVDDLVNYYLKTDTYTKDEVNSIIAAINQFHYEVYASTSEVTDPQSNVLYLIGPIGTGTDKYEEYVYTTTWVKIGDTSIDLSGYVTTQALNTALADYSTTSQMQSAISTALASYYTKQQTDTLLGGKQDTLTFDNVPTSGSDNPVKSGGVYDAIEEVDAKFDDYAKIDGAYEGMLAGNAMNLVDTNGTPILREFVFSKSGGSEQIATGTALIKRLRGNTIVWNQLVDKTGIRAYTGYYGLNIINNNDGSLSIVGTTTQNASPTLVILIDEATIPSGHKVLLKGGTSSIKIRLSYHGAVDTGSGSITTTTRELNSNLISVNLDSGTTYNDTIKPICIDLTQMFGAGNEPTSVEEFEALFPLDYYEYNAGELLSFSGDSIKTVGFNQWDEEWELGYFNTTTGENAVSTGQIRAKNYIHVIPSGIYYISVPSLVWAMFFDANKNVITSGLPTGNYATSGNCLGIGGTRANIVVMPSNCHYFRFYCQATYGTTYNHDICINLSNPSKNGTYEPYEEHTKNISFYKSIVDGQGNLLFPDASMHSAGDAYDEANGNKASKRILDVDMGMLSYSRYSVAEGTLFRFKINDAKSFSASSIPNVIIPKYTPVKQSYRANKTISANSVGYLDIIDNDYTSAADFKAAMQGVHLYIELAEPIEIDISEQNLAYQVDGGGTEQLLPENTSTPTTAPTRFDVNYGLDAMATLKNLQKNYLAQSDLDRMLTAMGTALGFTYTKTWDATNKQWDFTFTLNS